MARYKDTLNKAALDALTKWIIDHTRSRIEAYEEGRWETLPESDKAIIIERVTYALIAQVVQKNGLNQNEEARIIKRVLQGAQALNVEAI